mmetsp:Transcript_17608/g.38473  ORF Transcript_17608/g.38473 Transcript_17608/m.38473 type:complete len:85 (+) Transcript_17608:1667-1921(+)
MADTAGRHSFHFLMSAIWIHKNSSNLPDNEESHQEKTIEDPRKSSNISDTMFLVLITIRVSDFEEKLTGDGIDTSTRFRALPPR